MGFEERDRLTSAERRIADLETATARLPIREALGAATGAEADIIYARVNNVGGTAADTNLYNYDSGVSITGCVTAEATGQFRNNNQVLADSQRVILVKRQDTGEYEPEQAGEPSTVIIGRALVNDATGVAEGDATLTFDGAAGSTGAFSSATGTASNLHSKAFGDNEEILLIEDAANNFYAVKVEVDIQKAAVNDATDVMPTDATFAFDGGNVTVLEGVGEVSGTAKNPCAIAWSDDENILQILADDGQQIAIKQHDACVFFADAAQDVDSSDSSFSADTIVRLMNKEPGVTEPITVKNTVGAKLSDNDTFIAARDYLGEYEVLSVIAQTCVIFRCKPTSNLTGESSFTGGTLTEVFGTPPAGPTETINNPLALYSTTAGWITCVVKTDGTFEAIYAEEHVQQWLKAQSGYNAANEQGFTHNAGTFTWVDIDDTCP